MSRYNLSEASFSQPSSTTVSEPSSTDDEDEEHELMDQVAPMTQMPSRAAKNMTRRHSVAYRPEVSLNPCLAPRALSLESEVGYVSPNPVITADEGSAPAAIAPIVPLPRLGSTVGKRLWERVAMSEF
eukprot:sb/3475380/